MQNKEDQAVGCLVIDDPRLGENALSGLFSGKVQTYPFDWAAGEAPLPSLQSLLQSARRDCGEAAILARGLGCGAALALSEQLPVERLALIDPAPALAFRWKESPRSRKVRRLNAYARRNLSLCVAEALVVEGEAAGGFRRLSEGAPKARPVRLALRGESGEKLYTFCENRLKTAITHFLRGEEWRKELAENEEMCIIYG